MAELGFPVDELEKDELQPLIDTALYAKEFIIVAYYLLIGRCF